MNTTTSTRGVSEAMVALDRALEAVNAPLITDKANERAAWEAVSVLQSHGATLRAALTAALAQNTQGDAVPVNGLVADHLISGLGKLANTVSKRMANDIREVLSAMKPLYLHAERARVPDGMVLVPREPTPEMLDATDCAERLARVTWEKMLAAAPSQRAEVDRG